MREVAKGTMSGKIMFLVRTSAYNRVDQAIKHKRDPTIVGECILIK